MNARMGVTGWSAVPATLAAVVMAGLVSACAGVQSSSDSADRPTSATADDSSADLSSQWKAVNRLTTVHRDSDDLLTAGLGLTGLRSAAPSVANPEAPTHAELRRRAIWNNWRGIADLSPVGGYGDVYGSTEPVTGREFQQHVQLPGGGSHRVLLQLPDHFDPRSPCLLITASSGSRGIYGAIALAGAWGLPRGCAVVYTDKGAGTDLYDVASGEGTSIEGALDADRPLFSSAVGAQSGPWIAYPHAHSQAHPEADWGRHVRQAGELALQWLSELFPSREAFRFDNTRTIAVGVSNGAGAVLRAAEIEGDWLDGVVAVAPNVLAGEGGRALYDYATEAALWMGCAQSVSNLADAPLPLPAAAIGAQRKAACDQLIGAGLLGSSTPAADAYTRLRAGGWTDEALKAATLSTAFDLWRAVAVTYSSAYLKSAADQMPCGFAFSMLDAVGQPRASERSERSLWWSDSSGIAPGNGVALVHRDGSALNLLTDAQCLSQLWQGSTEESIRLQAAVAETRAGLPSADLPVLVIHGVDDGLVPEAFSAAPYVRWARDAGRDNVSYWRVRNAQHFDAFLALPDFSARYVPLLPYAYAGLDALWQQLDAGGKPGPKAGGAALGDRTLNSSRQGLREGQPVTLTPADLALPD